MKGALIIIAATVYATVRAIRNPWVGVVGYATFAVLCPPWNWRWSLPDLEYQKYLAIGTLLGFLLTGLRRNRLPRHLLVPLWCLWLFLLLCYLSGMQSINPLKSSFFNEIIGKIVLMSSLVAFLLQSSRQIAILIGLLIVAQGWNAFNINQLYFERGFIQVNYFSWNFLDNNTYCVSSLPIAAMSLAAAMCAEKKWHRWIAGFIGILQIHQLMLLESRGTMIGAVLSAGLLIVFVPKTARSLRTIAIVLVLGGVLAGPPVVEEFMSSFEADDDLDSSAESRYKLWKAGAAITKDYPLLGVGPWAGQYLVPRYYEGYAGARQNKALHNLFFEVSTGMGVPALGLYLLFFGLPWWYHLRVWMRGHPLPAWFRVVQLGVLAGLPGYWLASMFSSGALIESPYLLVVIGIVSLYVLETERAAPTFVGLPPEHHTAPSLV